MLTIHAPWPSSLSTLRLPSRSWSFQSWCSSTVAANAVPYASIVSCRPTTSSEQYTLVHMPSSSIFAFSSGSHLKFFAGSRKPAYLHTQRRKIISFWTRILTSCLLSLPRSYYQDLGMSQSLLHCRTVSERGPFFFFFFFSFSPGACNTYNDKRLPPHN